MPSMERNKKYPEDTLLGENSHGCDRRATHRSLRTRTAGPSLPLLSNRQGLHKANPGFLGWLVDPAKGFWSPLLKNLGKALVDTIPFPSLDDFVGSLSAELAAAIPGYGKAGSPAPEDELEKRYREMRSHAWAAEETAKHILVASSLLSSMPLIDVGDALDECWRLPGVSSLMREAEDILFAEYDVGRKPLLQRQILRTTTPLLPGYQDMISVYVREGYLKEKWVEIPPEFVENMKELGYSEAWTNQLWGKHWVLPGVDHLYEMFHKKIISAPELAAMLKYHDFEPVWRQRLIDNAYALIPRVDLRRAYMWGMPGFEDLSGRYEKLGFSPEDARAMDQIAKRFALSAYYSRVVTVARQTFRKGQLPGPDFQRILEEVHVPREAQDLIFEAETLARDSAVVEPGEEPRVLTASQTCTAYGKGLLALPAARDRLLGLGYLEADADLLLSLAAPKAEATEADRVRTVLMTRYKEGFLKADRFREALEELRFDAETIDASIKWADEAASWDDAWEQAQEWWRLAKARKITPEGYAKEVRALGMVEARITSKMKLLRRLAEIAAVEAAAKA